MSEEVDLLFICSFVLIFTGRGPSNKESKNNPSWVYPKPITVSWRPSPQGWGAVLSACSAEEGEIDGQNRWLTNAPVCSVPWALALLEETLKKNLPIISTL